jgi:hypothetical protein
MWEFLISPKKITTFFCLDTKETKNQEATSRSGKKRSCFLATIVVESLLRHFPNASAYRARINNSFFSIPHFSVASENLALILKINLRTKKNLTSGEATYSTR